MQSVLWCLGSDVWCLVPAVWFLVSGVWCLVVLVLVLVLVRTTGLTSARVARCRSDVGFFYIRHRGWFFWVWVVLKVLVVLALVRTTCLMKGSFFLQSSIR